MERNSARIQSFFGSVYWQTRRFVSTLVFGPHHSMRKYTFLVLIGFGLASVLIDLDHFIIAQTRMVRPAHLPILGVVWIVSISYYAYLNRWVYHTRVTRKKE